jgi:hypothetical protein
MRPQTIYPMVNHNMQAIDNTKKRNIIAMLEPVFPQIAQLFTYEKVTAVIDAMNEFYYSYSNSDYAWHVLENATTMLLTMLTENAASKDDVDHAELSRPNGLDPYLFVYTILGCNLWNPVEAENAPNALVVRNWYIDQINDITLVTVKNNNTISTRYKYVRPSAFTTVDAIEFIHKEIWSDSRCSHAKYGLIQKILMDAIKLV